MKNKKNVVFLVILIITLITAIGSFTYAYFKGQTGSSAKVDVKVETGTVDNLTFDKCSPVNITLTQSNFAERTGNQEGSTCVKATFYANNNTNSATEHYYAYIDIKENGFTYTTNNNTPEIILQVTDPNGNKVTSITGLTYNTELQGFDITTKKGLVTIADNYEIKVSNVQENPKIHEWVIKVIVRNLDSDQSSNAGKMLKVEGIIQKEERIITTYWNDSFGGNDYLYPSIPTTKYNTPNEIPELSTKPIYIRTDETSHVACLRYNSKDFCLPYGYGKDMTAEEIKEKLQADMEAAFEITVTMCNVESQFAACASDSVGDFGCYAGSSGYVDCFDSSSYCKVNGYGEAACSYFE